MAKPDPKPDLTPGVDPRASRIGRQFRTCYHCRTEYRTVAEGMECELWHEKK